MVTALLASILLRWVAPFAGSGPAVFAKTALTTTAVTTLVWLIVTFATNAEPETVLISFYRAVRPHVAGWQPIAQLTPDVPPTRDLGRNLVSWILGCAMVYFALFGMGHILIGPMGEGLLLLGGSAMCAIALYINLARQGWGTGGTAERSAEGTAPERSANN
jgi:hypothetical protein